MGAGKIGAIGLSEVSVARLREAQTVAPIAAVQNEYSLWSRNPELGMLEATRESGVALVAFSPVARGFLADVVRDPAELPANDLRHGIPRFQPEHWPANVALLPAWRALAPMPTAHQLSLHSPGCCRAAPTSFPFPGPPPSAICARTSQRPIWSSTPLCSHERGS